MDSYSIALNRGALKQFVRRSVDQRMIQHLAKHAYAVFYPEEEMNLVSKSQAQLFHVSCHTSTGISQTLPPLDIFIQSLAYKSSVQVPTLMTSLVYLARIKAHLPSGVNATEFAVYRIFLASLILAAKNLNDCSPTNRSWSRYTTVEGYDNFQFTTAAINEVEKEILFLLDWNTRVTEEDLFEHLEPFLYPIRSQLRTEYEGLKTAYHTVVYGLRDSMHSLSRTRKDSFAFPPAINAFKAPDNVSTGNRALFENHQYHFDETNAQFMPYSVPRKTKDFRLNGNSQKFRPAKRMRHLSGYDPFGYAANIVLCAATSSDKIIPSQVQEYRRYSETCIPYVEQH